ncbi:adhesion G protein-coupled receptor A1 [Sorex araneus]|uniref:adhesion G protein-coupled receptor A1 n=1 Tax=Sorex araneus TaxID=42254 RepID=UPI0024339E34|nr:adhesion G protein-coupled receptor A1 [Sorex araneus]
MDLKSVLSPPQHPGEFLHPVVYACTAVMLLCLLASVITYLVHQSAIRISREGRHVLLNFCVHTALTFSVFAGGINHTKYPGLCQAVGVTLHFCTLSAMLWLGVAARSIYEQVTKKAPPCPSAHQQPGPRQPLLRSYLIGGGVPFIICGVTAATNIRNYGKEDEDSAYCWMAWEPSLGAFYGPAAFIALGTCVYLLGAYVQLRRHPERRYELREVPEERPRAPPGSPPARPALAASLLQNEHSLPAQLRAAACSLGLFAATWAFGALAVTQGPLLDMVFSCLYGAFCVTLGLFVLIHHCAKREDVWQRWWACCPARAEPPAGPLCARPAPHADGEALGPPACLPDSPCPGQPRGFGHLPAGPCQLAGLPAPGHPSCLSPATPCCATRRREQLLEEDVCGHHLLPRTRPPCAQQAFDYHLPSSLDGSPQSSCTDSAPSSLEGPLGAHALACCAQGGAFPVLSQPDGLYGCGLRPGREAACGPVHLEMLHRTQSLPCGGPGLNGLFRGDEHGARCMVSIRTGPWRNETSV